MESEEKQKIEELIQRRVLAVSLRESSAAQFDSLLRCMQAHQHKYDRIIGKSGNEDLRQGRELLQQLIDKLAAARLRYDDDIAKITALIEAKGVDTLN